MIAPSVDGSIVQSIPSLERPNRCEASMGLVYLTCTLVCMAVYVGIIEPSTTNDLYWASFNRSGCSVFLVDIVNAKLQSAGFSRAQPTTVDLLSAPDVVSPKHYADAGVQTTHEATYGRYLVYSELASLARSIGDLRATSTKAITTIYAQYCWVDLDRRWELAHSSARAARCLERYKDNAANYLETTVRNTDWTTFVEWNNDTWGITIAAALAKTPDGVHWLADRPRHALSLSIDDEVQFLEYRNLTRFELQYQNDFSMVISETIDVVNALDQRRTVWLKGVSFASAPWTTVLMYWNFRNDLLIFASLNQSLVRGDESHFEQSGFRISYLYGVSDDDDRYYDQFGVFYDQIGPFGCVDVLYVPLPAALKTMYAAIHDLVGPRVVMMSPAVPIPSDNSQLMLVPSPPNFLVPLGMTYLGGNLLCFDNPPTAFPQSQFTMRDACTESKPFSMVATKRAMVFALLATPNPEVPAICAVQATVEIRSCKDILTQLANVVEGTSRDKAKLRHLTSAAAASLSTIQFFQYAQPPNSTEWTLLQQPLLVEDDPNWSFYGWLALFDWIEGKREVVRLEGDVSTVTMMSDLNPPVEGTSTSQYPDEVQSGPKMLLYLVYYTTGMAVALGVVVCSYAVRSGIAFAGRNLLAFHRVAIIVWIGRPLLFLRGLTVILVLSTTTAVLVRDEVDVAKLVTSPRSWWEIFLLAGESTCVCVVICDLLLITATESAHLFTPLACLLSWGVAVVLEVTVPISVELILDRQCTNIDLQRGVTCTAGTLAVGSFHRMAVLLAVQGASVLVSLVGVVLLKRDKPQKQQQSRPPLLLYGAAVVYLNNQDHLDAWHPDDVACVLTGLVPFSFGGAQYTFDVKLWVLLQIESPSSRGKLQLPDNPGPTLAPSEPIPAMSRKAAFYRQLTALAGFGYLIMSVIGSVSYISVSTVNFANDMYWATFNMTGHHAVIATWFHLNLPNRDVLRSVQLDEARWTTEASNYSNPKLRINSYSLIGSILQLKHTTKLDVAIAGLRRSDACGIPWISTQYCWVDFGRQWPMANSAARQRRCHADAANGAVYLEAVLRNVEWAAWTACWGASFDAAIANELKLTVQGQAWLATTQAAFATDIASEIDVWHQAGIDEYVVQWQNYKSLGLINTYVIENALGVQYPMTLRRSNGSYSFPYQTSFKMYWGLGSDLWAVASNSTSISGKSLISTSANYAFANVSMVAVLLENHTIDAPLYQAFQVIQGEIGPFGSIDMRVVPCPTSVQAMVATAIDVIQRTVTTPSIASHSFFDVPNDIMFPIPGPFKRLAAASFKTTGGNIMCPESGDNDLERTLLRLTHREYTCGGSYAADLPTGSYGLLFAAMSAQLSLANKSKLDGVCWHLADSEQCLATFLTPTVSFVQEFIRPIDAAVTKDRIAPAVTAVRQLQVSLMQFLRNPTGDIELGRASLLDPDDASFDFWSWMYVFSWATGGREVVTFQGDVGAITVITDVAESKSQAIYNEDLPTTFATYAQRGVQYITGVMLAVAGCAGLCILSSRWRVEGRNMFKLNRVAGIVWVGRPLLLLRGVTALCLLSTSTLELVRVGDFFAAFQVSRLPWYTAVLGAGEVTWVAYVLNDVLMVWTTDLTQGYAASSSIFIWVTCAVLTVVWPVGHRATIDPACQIDQMDFQLVCQSGVVAIGDSTRLVWLVAIVVLWNAVCFAGPWLAYRSRLPSKSAHASLLLSTGAKFLFDRTHWMYGGVYHMDTASALLNGVVALPWGRTVYVVDVKLWRAFVLAVEADVPERLVRAVPLPR